MVRKQFLLRIDPELWKELEKWAADDLRSVNAQVEWLLREAARKHKGGQGRSGSVAGEEVDEDASDEVGDVQSDAAEPLVRRRS
jgi:hypothetical protein